MKKYITFTLLLILLIHFGHSSEYTSDSNTLLLLHLDEFFNEPDVGWFFNDSSGNYNFVKDTSYNKFKFVSGVENKSVFFNDGNFIQIEQKENYDLNDSFTIELYFVKFRDYALPIFTETGMVYKTSKPNAPLLFISSNGNLTFSILKNGTTYYFSSNQKINSNQWYYVAITYDKKRLTMYINGEKDNSEYVGEIPSIIGNTEFLEIGRTPLNLYPGGLEGGKEGYLGYYFDGLMDEIRISNTARIEFNLNQEMISTNMSEKGVGEYFEQERLKQLEEDNWASTKATNTLPSYYSYIESFPNGSHLEEANSKIDELKIAQEQKRIEEERRQKEFEEQQRKENLKKWFMFSLVFVLVSIFIFYFYQKEKKEKEEEQKRREEEKIKQDKEREKKEAERLVRERVEELKQKKEEQRRKRLELERKQKQQLAEEKFARFQREKGLELFEGKWVDKKEIPKLKEIQIGLDKNFQNLSSYEFEKFIAKLFRAMGYETRVTQASNDYGIDVVAEKGNEKIAIQCKRYRPGNPVSNRDVQRLLGAMQLKNMRATHSILITTSHFTVQAREQAKECAIELWDRHDLEKMVRKYLMKI